MYALLLMHAFYYPLFVYLNDILFLYALYLIHVTACLEISAQLVITRDYETDQ